MGRDRTVSDISFLEFMDPELIRPVRTQHETFTRGCSLAPRPAFASGRSTGAGGAGVSFHRDPEVREQGRPPTQYFYCILALCATLGASLEIEVVGYDEQNAVEAVERVFMADADAPDNSG